MSAAVWAQWGCPELNSLQRQHQRRLGANVSCIKLKEDLSREGGWAVNYTQVCRLQILMVVLDAVQNRLFQ